MEPTEIYTFNKIEEALLQIKGDRFEECDNYVDFIKSKRAQTYVIDIGHSKLTVSLK